ncbi:hypothetical protein [Pseudoprimorskyibacter insulae]|uniref:hypothetical protein n=1 Tax=Pseudoprimorskyibacter insulae TaxID=1695997 RepID=UPI000D54C4E1|nr:hypothetical protein [Pseudoprimorskyibacter insulae]
MPLPIPYDRDTREISVVTDEGLKSMARLPQNLKDARQAMFNDQIVDADDLKALADRGDTLAALHFVDVLKARGIENNPSDTAYYAAIAVGGGRVWALPEMVQAMHMLDPKTEPKARVNKYISVLYPHAWAGNTLALEAVMSFNGEGRLFGPLSSATKAKIDEQLETQTAGRFDLQRAVDILRKPTLTEAELGTARTLLERAQNSDHLAVATTAANLLEQLAANHYGNAAQNN